MRLLSELLSDWVGILSLLVIAITLGMGAWFTRFFAEKSHEVDPADSAKVGGN